MTTTKPTDPFSPDEIAARRPSWATGVKVADDRANPADNDVEYFIDTETVRWASLYVPASQDTHPPLGWIKPGCEDLTLDNLRQIAADIQQIIDAVETAAR